MRNRAVWRLLLQRLYRCVAHDYRPGFGGSGIFPKSVEQGKWIAAQIPKGEFVPFYEGGHLLYWLEADKFNQAVTDFADRL